jgi:sulfatase modifying factor 1
MNRRHTLSVVVGGMLCVASMGAKEPPGAVNAELGKAAPDGPLQTPVWAAVMETGAASSTILANVDLKTPMTAPAELPPSPCAANMVEVEGDYCPWLEQKCLRWIDPETKMRCAEFAPTSKCQSKTTRKHFCIDRFEYPNVPGEKPVVMKTWYEAQDACKAQGKRLCGDSEWTLACEGQERMPYPYGYARNAEACNIDRPHPEPNERLLANPATRDAEAARLDQREVSGGKEACVSPFGVHDMTGNVDEWVINESGAPYKSGLKGGYWGPVRTRCRPMTTAHSEIFSFYQIGFRCCGDIKEPRVADTKAKVETANVAMPKKQSPI